MKRIYYILLAAILLFVLFIKITEEQVSLVSIIYKIQWLGFLQLWGIAPKAAK